MQALILLLYFVVAGGSMRFLKSQYKLMPGRSKDDQQGFALFVAIFWPLSLPVFGGYLLVGKWIKDGE